MSICLVNKLVKYSKFKNAEFPRRRGVSSSSLNENSLLHYNKVLSCKKKIKI